jgi:hypothetical protein
LVFGLTGRSWTAAWEPVQIGIFVAGSDDAPHPVLLATARDVVDRWEDIEQEIEAYLYLFVRDGGEVELDPPNGERFAASDCGFIGRLYFMALTVLDTEEPRSAVVHFYTGQPVDYVTFDLQLLGGIPGSVCARTTK